MSTFNDSVFNQSDVTDPAQSPFPELYIRNFLNDQGNIPLELTPLAFTIEIFSAILNQTDFILSQNPSLLYSPIVYLNGSPIYLSKDYTINAQTISLSSTNPGDVLTVRYSY
jgi:hypothetical protein